MAELKDWSTAAASNNATPPDGFPEGMAYQSVNDAAREVMAVLARQHKDTSGELVSSGTADALTLTPYGAYSSFADGDRISFTLHLDVNASATLQVGTTAAVAIHDRTGSAIAASTLSSGDIVDVVYRSSAWRCIGVTNPVTIEMESSLVTGMIIPYGGGTTPDGFLACDGAAVSRTTYSDLFTALGTTFGAGDGSTTFNVPDLGGRVPLGQDTDFSRGDTGGSADAIVVSHSHEDDFAVSSAGSHAHEESLTIDSAGSHDHDVSVSIANSSSHVHAGSAVPADGDSGTTNFRSARRTISGTQGNPDTIQSLTGILTGVGGVHSHTATVTETAAGSHDHTISGSIDSAGAHTHDLTGSVSTAGASGSDANLQPYTVTNWIIKT